jgi:lysophospholipase L1-like esterase
MFSRRRRNQSPIRHAGRLSRSLRWRLRFASTRSFADLKKGMLVALVFLALIEGVLRLVGFEFDRVPHRVELYHARDLAEQNREGEQIQRHPTLLWALVPGATLGKITVNDAGFIGRMPTLVPRPGTLRIVCLGDSNVALGEDPYPQVLQALLDRERPGRFEVINAGVPGYTSLQGLRLLEGRVADYAPHLVTVQFGWNDHWLSDRPMSQRLAEPSRAFTLQNALVSLRLYQLGLYFRSRMGGSVSGETVEYQVPPDEYREYLQRMVALGHERDFRVLLLTVPGNFKLHTLRPFLRVGFRPDHPSPRARPQALLEIHQRLNDIVRQVATEGALLVDLDRRFADLADRDAYFLEDAIHTSQRGRSLIAEELARRILLDESARSLDPRPPDAPAAGAGHYALDDPRVMLKSFWPLEQSPADQKVYRAAIRTESRLIIAGLRLAPYQIALRFEQEAAGRAVSYSVGTASTIERTSISADGRVILSGRHRPDGNGVLSIRLINSPTVEGGIDSAGASSERGPVLVEIELLE